MQYKIPVQIENEDPIMLGLSLRQIIIVLGGGSIAYALFNGLAPNVGSEVAAFPAILILIFFIVVAIFKNHEMTFVPFILSFFRYKINYPERKWQKGSDSSSPIDIGYVAQITQKQETEVDFESKMDKIQKIDESLEKLN